MNSKYFEFKLNLILIKKNKIITKSIIKIKINYSSSIKSIKKIMRTIKKI